MRTWASLLLTTIQFTQSFLLDTTAKQQYTDTLPSLEDDLVPVALKTAMEFVAPTKP